MCAFKIRDALKLAKQYIYDIYESTQYILYMYMHVYGMYKQYKYRIDSRT